MCVGGEVTKKKSIGLLDEWRLHRQLMGFRASHHELIARASLFFVKVSCERKTIAMMS